MHLFNYELSLSRIFNGLTKGIKGVYNRRGEIAGDIRKSDIVGYLTFTHKGNRALPMQNILRGAGKGLEGGLEGYRDVRDNAPLGIRLWLRFSLMTVEIGATAGLSEGATTAYDMFSGAYFDTPITSRYVMYGHIIHIYMQDLSGVYYKDININPYSF